MRADKRHQGGPLGCAVQSPALSRQPSVRVLQLRGLRAPIGLSPCKHLVFSCPSLQRVALTPEGKQVHRVSFYLRAPLPLLLSDYALGGGEQLSLPSPDTPLGLHIPTDTPTYACPCLRGDPSICLSPSRAGSSRRAAFPPCPAHSISSIRRTRGLLTETRLRPLL